MDPNGELHGETQFLGGGIWKVYCLLFGSDEYSSFCWVDQTAPQVEEPSLEAARRSAVAMHRMGIQALFGIRVGSSEFHQIQRVSSHLKQVSES